MTLHWTAKLQNYAEDGRLLCDRLFRGSFCVSTFSRLSPLTVHYAAILSKHTDNLI